MRRFLSGVILAATLVGAATPARATCDETGIRERMTVATSDGDIDTMRLDGSSLYVNLRQARAMDEVERFGRAIAATLAEIEAECGRTSVTVFVTHDGRTLCQVTADRSGIRHVRGPCSRP
jgi:hypothetical protein